MEKKINFSLGGFGAAGFSGKIPSPEITLKCENCSEIMVLVSGIGLINSGTHTFIAECPKCKNKQKFNNDTIWKDCMQKSHEIKKNKN